MNQRVYKPDDVMKYIEENSKIHFDPKLVKLFLKKHDDEKKWDTVK